MRGKAAIFQGPGKGYEVRELEVPEPEPEAVLIRVSMAGVCGSDLHFWRGDSPLFGRMSGQVGGHEMTGRVAGLGSAVKTDSLGQPLKEGDRVAYAYFRPCGRCYACNQGQAAACPNKTRGITPADVFPHFTGAYAEYYYLRPGQWVFKVPDDLSDEIVAPVNCALSQVLYGLRRAGVKMGDTVVVQGAGGLGLNACAVAKEMGAERVIAIDGLPTRLELAKQFGADEVIDIRQATGARDRVGRVMELTQGRGADVVGEFVGLPGVVPEGIQMVRPGGTYLEIGNISFGQTVALDPSALVWGSKSIVGVVMYESWVIPEALDFLQRTRGRYPFDRTVSHRYALEDINQAFSEAEWNREGADTATTRAVVTP